MDAKDINIEKRLDLKNISVELYDNSNTEDFRVDVYLDRESSAIDLNEAIQLRDYLDKAIKEISK